jgi:hypothetical protein
MSSNASGVGAFLVAPNYSNQFIAGATGTPTNLNAVNFSGSFVSQGDLISGVNQVRLVSWGARIRRIVAPLNASGMVRIRKYGDTDAAGFAVLDCDSYARTESFDVPLQDAKQIHILGSHTSQPAANFYAPDDFTSTPGSALVGDWVAGGFGPLTIGVDGAPASTGVLDIEIIAHWELQFGDASAMTLLATPSPKYDPLVTAAAAKVTSAASSIFNAGASAVGEMLKKRAATAIGSLIGGPAGGAMALTTYEAIREVD